VLEVMVPPEAVLERVPVPWERWLAGLTVIIRFQELATIMSVTWSSVLPFTSIPFTYNKNILGT
jgi:hypothetical protein